MHQPFMKYHGLGNDFVLLDALTHPLEFSQASWKSIAIRLCERHAGIGADGVLILEGTAAAPAIRIINADGSFAGMCGNGIRCVARHLVEHHGAPADITIITPSGKVDVAVLQSADEAFHSATVDMGRPILEPHRVPVAGVTDVLRFAMPRLAGSQEWRREAGVCEEASAVSMGNPHLIVRCNDLQAVPLHVAGPALEHHPMFPDRINVHFVQTLGTSHVRVITWERGCGPTRACGSGACAVAVAFSSLGITGRDVTVSLPGGDLDISCLEDGRVLMRGPATFAFRGFIDLRECGG